GTPRGRRSGSRCTRPRARSQGPRSDRWSRGWCPPSSGVGPQNDGHPAVLGLQVTVHEVDLLQPAKALADVLRTDLPHAVDRLQLRIGGGEDLVQPAELAHDVLHHQLRKPWNAAKNAIPAGGDGIVQGVDLAVVAQQLGQAAEVEKVL